MRELLGRLVVPARGDGLQDEAGFLEVGRVLALPELVGGEAVAVGGERLHDVLEGVGRGEPGRRVEVRFYACDLRVEVLGDEEVGAVVEVFEEALELGGVFVLV